MGWKAGSVNSRVRASEDKARLCDEAEDVAETRSKKKTCTPSLTSNQTCSARAATPNWS